MKHIFISTTATFLLFLSGCKLANLQTEESIKKSNEAYAIQLKKEMGIAHGIENWKKISTYTVQFEDEWFGFLGKSANPYKQSKTSMNLQYIPNTFDGRLQFLSGKQKEEYWGIQSWNTYIIKDSEVTFKKHKDALFFLPTYQYFIEFPLRIQTATAHSYVGEKEINGIVCEGILLSWKTTNPQKDTDQYLAWIDKENKLLIKLEYTIRDALKFAKGATNYDKYIEYNGIKIATEMPVKSNLVKKGYLHFMKIKDFKTNTVTKDQLRPNKELTNSTKP